MLSRSVSDPESIKQLEQIRDYILEMRSSGLLPDFKPVIYYNGGLQVVEVFIADTSYCETHLTNEHYIAVFERNHHSRYDEKHFVGFSIWVVRGVCARMGIEPVGMISMRRILKFLHEDEKDQFVKDAITEIMLPMLEDHDLDLFELPA